MTSQTKLGFNQKKPGTTTRPLQQKYANKALRSAHATSGDDVSDQAFPEEHLLEKIGNLSQTMEEKLAEYQRKKKEKVASAVDKMVAPSLNLNRSLRSSTKASKEIGKESGGITKPAAKPITRTRLSTKSSTSLVQTDISRSFQLSKTTVETETIETASQEAASEETEAEEEEAVIEPETSSTQRTIQPEKKTETEEVTEEETQDGPVTKVQEVQSEENDLETSAQKIEDKLDQKQKKTAVEDTVYISGEDEDIHPLARTVVVAKPLSPQKPTKQGEQNIYTTKPHVSKPAHAFSRAQEKLKDTALPMPGHMKTLTAIFKGLEDLIVFNKSQGQLCFYHRLKKPVQVQSSRNFEIKHLAQLRTVWPDGYKFTQSPCLFEGQRVQSVLIEQLAPKEEPTGYFVPRAERRSKAFLEHMQAYIQHYHKKFLESSDPPRTDTYPHSWHPDFDLENVPPIEEGVPLLKPVIVDSSRLDLSGLSSRRALEIGHKSKADSLLSTKASSAPSLPSPASSTASSPSGEGSSAKPLTALEQLKEKIRQQQLARKESTVGLATPEEKQQRLVASRLPAVFDLIRFKRIEVISLKALTEQVVKSSRMPISEQEGKQSLEMLAERLPDWCSVYQLNDGMYFKVLKKADGEAHDIRALRTRLVSGVVAK
ncbi:hypothetical protein BGZ93_000955 [Podila epicladia]|nr:hypothetical protein BGZ92_002400 [Podila epicladia]KAG0084902.1 hypothetical protein BGZ93_000955 [Podila epicladia]